MQSRFSRKTFLAKIAGGLSVAGFASSLFSSRAEASSLVSAPAGPAVKSEARAISRDISAARMKR